MKIKGKYKGNKNIELSDDINFPLDSEIVLRVEEVIGPENKKEKKRKNSKPKEDEEHPLLQIAKRAIHFGRSDLSEKHHEILGELIE